VFSVSQDERDQIVYEMDRTIHIKKWAPAQAAA
jgi:hypothetical protein